MKRLPELLGLLALGWAASCSPRAEGARPATPTRSQGEARPVFLEAAPAPDPVLVSSSSEAVISLRTPHARAEAQRLFDDYLRAIVHESNSELSRLLTDDATIRYGLQSQGGSALSSWVRRFTQRDYTVENPSGLYDPERFEVFGVRDVGGLDDGWVFTPEGSQLVVRVRLSPSSPSGRFGEEMQLLLVPGAEGLLIRRIFERGYSEP